MGVTVALALLAGTWLMLDRGNSRPVEAEHPVDRVAQAWREMVRAGLRREGIEGPPQRWPFSALEPAIGGMPPQLRAEAREVLGSPAPMRLRFDEARYGRAPTGVGLWMVPGRGVTCMFRAVSIASTCIATVDAYRYGMLLQTYKVGKAPGIRPSHFVVLGVAPDGAKTVSVKFGERTRTVPIVDNAFRVQAEAQIRVVGLNR